MRDEVRTHPSTSQVFNPIARGPCTDNRAAPAQKPDRDPRQMSDSAAVPVDSPDLLYPIIA